MKEYKAKPKKMKCSHCHGKGQRGYVGTCAVCKGKGWLLR